MAAILDEIGLARLIAKMNQTYLRRDTAPSEGSWIYTTVIPMDALHEVKIIFYYEDYCTYGTSRKVIDEITFFNDILMAQPALVVLVGSHGNPYLTGSITFNNTGEVVATSGLQQTYRVTYLIWYR